MSKKQFSINFISFYNDETKLYHAQCAQMPDFEVTAETEGELREEIHKRMDMAALDKRNGLIAHYGNLIPEFKVITLSAEFNTEKTIVINSDSVDDIEHKIDLAESCKVHGWSVVYALVPRSCEKLYLNSIKDKDLDGEIIRLKSIL